MADFGYIRDYYAKRYGMPAHQANAMAAHAMRESSGKPDAVGDGGKARGVFQWHPDRYKNLASYAKERNASPTDLNIQLDFAHHEMTKGAEQHAGGKLVNASDDVDANKAMLHYLRPAGYTYAKPEGAHEYTARLALARGGGAKMADIDAWGGSVSPYPAPYAADSPYMQPPPGMNLDQEIASWKGYGPGLLSRMGDRFMNNLDDPKKMKELAANSSAQMGAGAGLLSGSIQQAPGNQMAPPQAHIPPPQQGPPMTMTGIAPAGGMTPMNAAPQLTPAQMMLMKMGFTGMGGGMR